MVLAEFLSVIPRLFTKGLPIDNLDSSVLKENL